MAKSCIEVTSPLPNVDDDPREHEALQGRRGIEGAGRGIGGRIAFVSRGGALDRGGNVSPA